MNIITFDGYSGSGKTTQSVKVSEMLGFPMVNIKDYVWNVDDFFVENGHRRLTGWEGALRDAAILHVMRRQWLKNEGVVVEDRWFKMLADLQYDYEEDLDEAIDLYRKILRFTGGVEPCVSFYLDVSYVESRCRATYRNHGIQMTTEEKKKLHSSHFIDYHTKFRQFWKWLGEKVSYLHIINGEQPEEAVTAEIIQILCDNGIIR